MNAKRMQTTCVVAGVSLLSACLVLPADAAPAARLMLTAALAGQVSSPQGNEQLSRADVDKILRQAQQAIQAGNYDQASALIDRAERAQIRYPLLHFGPTPSSVRRELAQAQSERPAARPTTKAKSDDRYAVTAAAHEDEADTANPFDQLQPPLPTAITSQPIPPSGDTDDAMLALSTADSSTTARVAAPRALPEAPLPPSIGQASNSPNQASNAHSAATDKARALEQLAEARQALASGNLDLAEELARAASAAGVPESQFLPSEDRPSLVAWALMQAREQQRQYPETAVGRAPADSRYVEPTRATQPDPRQQAPALRLVQPQAKPSAIELAPSATAPLDNPASMLEMIPYSASDDAPVLLEEGEAALRRHDREAALECFGEAYLLREQLDPDSLRRLQDHLQMLSAESARQAESPRIASATPSLLDTASADQEVLARQLSADVGKLQSEARRMREEDPQQALKMLQDMRQQVENSALVEVHRSQLLRRLDITTDETEQYIEDHRAEIELDERNRAVLAEVERNREVKIKVQQQVADLIEQFNQLRDEHRYAEMEVVARRLIELAPDDEVARQLWQMAKFIRREILNRQLVDRRDERFWATLNDVENSAVPEVGDGHELIYDQKRWRELVQDRTGISDRNNRRTERELEIERRLKTPILLRYDSTPLSQVVEGLSQLAGVNIHLDPRGLSQEGIHSDTPITINLNKEISLKSALNLILGPLHLSYVIKDEVLKITSEQLRDGELVTVTYNVADLVIPIPNFVPSNNIGLQGLINDAHAAMGYGQGIGAPGPTVLLSDRGPRGAATGNDQVLAQQFGGAANTMAPSSVPIGSGPGGMGGGANADFDSLIDLIVSTVATETWAENGGGEAEVRPFPTNLSLVISQTQAVHEEIADLLEQLRRLQDLQVTIEVRFIRLNDSFFERIGVDFNMNIQDRSNGFGDLAAGGIYEGGRQSAVLGVAESAVGGLPVFTTDLDIPFRQGSFAVSEPTLGGVNPGSYATLGFAILSDIEAYFLIEAAQGDRRTNVLNAPKVTLFNGQQAFVADAVSQPFVVGVIPVVAEFVAAQQPIIVVLNEGTMMTIQAVVSDDRRYVRLTVVPFFTEIGDVQEFTFEGASSSTSASSSTDDDGDGNNNQEEESEEIVRSGITVQLPAFQFVTVVTTVSVPDGGTVLLGGIKRLSEGRNEFGVPLLSKVPYINRLFRNVGIGRETDSLMMMVTPRIIIQEEEEERLGVAVP